VASFPGLRAAKRETFCVDSTTVDSVGIASGEPDPIPAKDAGLRTAAPSAFGRGRPSGRWSSS
jgi:hypothetical protein